MIALATTNGNAAAAGIGVSATTKAMTPHQRHTLDEVMNLSGALLTSAFQTACSSAAVITALKTRTDKAANRHESVTPCIAVSRRWRYGSETALSARLTRA